MDVDRKRGREEFEVKVEVQVQVGNCCQDMMQIGEENSLEKNACQCYEVNMTSYGSIQIHTETEVGIEIDIEVEVEIEIEIEIEIESEIEVEIEIEVLRVRCTLQHSIELCKTVIYNVVTYDICYSL